MMRLYTAAVLMLTVLIAPAAKPLCDESVIGELEAAHIYAYRDFITHSWAEEWHVALQRAWIAHVRCRLYLKALPKK